MMRNPLVYWGVVSLGFHMVVIATLLVSGAMVRRKPTILDVSYIDLSQQPVPEKRKGNAGLTVAKRSFLKPKRSARKTRPVLPKNIRQKPPVFPATAKPSLEPKRAPTTSGVPCNNSDETPGVSVKSPGQERQAYRPFPDDKSGREAGLLPMTKTEESVADPAGSPIDTALLEATPISAENSLPTYPRTARRQGWEGEVWLRVRVAEIGQVLEVRIERSSGHSILDRAALEAVRNWHFHPSHLSNMKRPRNY